MKITIKIKTSISKHLTSPRIFVLSFAITIIIGALLLSATISSSNSLRFIDALFTSTSAVCVTGLTVINIGEDLTLFGQIITLILFQMGGLGIITFSTIFFVMMGRGIPFKEKEIVQSSFLYSPSKDFIIILKWIVLFSFFFEAIGAILLFMRFSHDFSDGVAFYQAIYHAVSAFNNCGFSLFSNNLIEYRKDFLVNLTIMGLIVIGGIGFIVQYEIFTIIRGIKRRLSLHSRIVLTTTILLILLGAILFYFFEQNHSINKISMQEKILISFFQSITSRTCGFNTIEIGILTNQTILLLLILMFIGASPGSTGGGIKTTSFTLLLLLIWNRFKGNEDVNVFNRTIPKESVNRMISIIFASSFTIAIITSALLISGGKHLPVDGSRYLFIEYLFEVVSAFGTVGLSMGVTPKLSDFQKMAIIIMMFTGRVGPLTLAYSLSRIKTKKEIKYAEEGIMVG